MAEENKSPDYVGVRRVPIVEWSGGKRKEVGWAHVTEDGKVIDQDITDPDTIMRLHSKVGDASFSIARDRETKQSDILYDSINRINREDSINEIPDTFKG